jgi:hypothetical protein
MGRFWKTSVRVRIASLFNVTPGRSQPALWATYRGVVKWGIANILPLAHGTQEYRVTFDRANSCGFTVHKEEGKVHFKMSELGLWFSDLEQLATVTCSWKPSQVIVVATLPSCLPSASAADYNGASQYSEFHRNYRYSSLQTIVEILQVDDRGTYDPRLTYIWFLYEVGV